MNLTILEETLELDLTEDPILVELCAGEPGPVGPGVPAGGETGQILKKSSGTDYDTEWGTGGAGSVSVTVGCTRTLDPGSPASVENTGTDTDVILNFGIPAGRPGADGSNGAAAGFGSVTASAAALPAGSDPAVSVSASGPDTARNFVFSFGIPAGETGSAGPGVPAGGTAGQILAKTSAADYAAAWVDPESGLPSGGSTGQVLAKESAADGDTGWHNAVDLIGTVPISQGGTGAVSADAALKNLISSVPLLAVQKTTGAAFTIGHSTSDNFKDVVVTPSELSGYSVLAPAGYEIQGAGCSYAQVSRFYLDSSGAIHVYLKNLDTQNRTWTPYVYGLYVSNKILP